MCQKNDSKLIVEIVRSYVVVGAKKESICKECNLPSNSLKNGAASHRTNQIIHKPDNLGSRRPRSSIW